MLTRIIYNGRVSLPWSAWNTAGIGVNTPLNIEVEGDSIVIKKIMPPGTCVICDEQPGEVAIHGRLVCLECVLELNNKSIRILQKHRK